MIMQINGYTNKSFENYTGPIDNEIFKSKNIFFGYNGKGKSALSKGIIVELTKNPSITENDYRYFNKDYIKENLLLDGSNGIKGIIANFGKSNVDVEKKIEELEKEIKNETELEDEIKKYSDKAIEEIEKIFNTKKGNSSIKKKNATTIYELRDQYIKDLEPAIKIVKDKDKLKDVKDSSIYEKEILQLESSNIIKIEILTNDELDKLKEIMDSSYNDNKIPTPLVLSWIEKGLEIHKNDTSTHCKFCGNSFNIQEIEKKVNEYLQDKKQQGLIELDKIYVKLNLIIDLKEKIEENKILFNRLTEDECNTNYNNLLTLIETLNPVLTNVKEKKDDFDKPKHLEIKKIKETMKQLTNNLEEIADIKNKKIINLKSMIEKGNTLIKGSIAIAIEENTFIKEQIELCNNKKQELEKIISNNKIVNQEIDKLKNSKSTTNDFATFINELLEPLGIDFYLDIIDDNYLIKHKVDNVTLKIDDISEGENNLLALLFFYYELFNDNKQQEFKSNIKTIIVDDPISSVDDINKVYILELIKKIINISEPQVFIFTHVWEDFCNLCYGKQDTETTPYRFYEIKKNTDGSYIKKTKYNETPYKHDFKEIYEFSKLDLNSELDECEIYHYPNVMRKVLEEYMKFKVANSSPTLDNISNVKVAICGNVNNVSHQDEIQIPALLDVCNIMSHKSARNPEQVLKCAEYLMRKIKEIDINHFSTMTG